MIYADTSALGKLFLPEPESEALRHWLVEQRAQEDNTVVTSVVGIVELHRVAARSGASAQRAARQLVSRIDQRGLTATTVALASRLPPPSVRTLDALHIATAAELPELTHLVTYDHRMLEAAAGYGLPTASPA